MMFHEKQFVGWWNLIVCVVGLSLAVSFWVIHESSVLKSELRVIQRDLLLQFIQLQSSNTLSDDLSRSDAWELPDQRLFTEVLQRIKRELPGYTSEHSFLQLEAKGDEKPQLRGNVTIIPWNVAVQHGPALATLNNRIRINEGSYFMVYGQVLYLNPSEVMGHVITRRTSSTSGKEQTTTSLLRCLQEMSKEKSVNSCYTAGIVRLDFQDELELVVPERPEAQIAMDTESTFFGVIQL